MGNPLLCPAPVIFHFIGGSVNEGDSFFVMQTACNTVADAAGAIHEVIAPVEKILDVIPAVTLDHAGVERVASHDPVQLILCEPKKLLF